MNTIEGGCECRAVRFAAQSDDTKPVVCHCSKCRRWSGYLWASINADLASLQIEGEQNVKWRRSSPAAERGFCGECGSSLFFKDDGAATISIAIGALDDIAGFELVADIFVEGAPAHLEPSSGRPQYARSRNEEPIG